MPSCKEVKVYMENRLTSAGIGVVDDPKTVLSHTFFLGKTGSDLEDMADQVIVLRYEPEGTGDVFSRYDEKMHGSNRCNVLNGYYQIVLINLLGGNIVRDYFTKNAIIH